VLEEVAVHRVTEFMGQRAHVIILAVIVEEHVGVNVIGPPLGVRARPFSVGGVDIQPPFRKSLARDFDVVPLPGVQARRGRAFPPPHTVVDIHVFHERTVQVVVMELSTPIMRATEPKVPVKRPEVAADIVHEAR